MRGQVLVLVALAAAGCGEPGGFKCDPGVPRQCVHADGTYAVCIPHTHRCAVMDAACSSGYRYDTNAGTLAGQCVPTDITIPPAPDMGSGDMLGTGGEHDMSMPDLATPDGPALDLSITVSAPDMLVPASWNTFTVSGAPRLLGVWGNGPGDVYVVGGPQQGAMGGTILHSTGNDVWVPQGTTPARPYTYQAIWGSGAGDIYAAYSSATPSHSTGEGTWAADQTFADSNLNGTQWQSVWGSSNSDVYMVAFGKGMIAHSAGGGSWTLQQRDVTLPPLFGVWGSSASNVFVVGGTSTSAAIWHSAGGGAWNRTEQKPAVGTALLAIAGTPSASAIYAVGASGVILQSSGAGGTWTPRPVDTPTSASLRGVWASSSGGDVFVVGDAGTILHSKAGAAFVHESSSPPTTANLLAVWGSGAGDVYAVGETGVIVHLR